MIKIADSLEVLERNGGDDEIRTRDLCRDRQQRRVTYWISTVLTARS